LRRFLAVILFFAAAGLAEAAVALIPEPALSCGECHQQVSLRDSVHARLACVDCHAALEPRAGTPPHQSKKDVPPPTCAGPSCHAAPAGAPQGGGPAAYADSVHGRAYLERHEPEVARCWDCHGDHAIRPVADAGSPVNRRNIPLTCSRCHEDMAVVLRYNIHAASPYREYSRSVHGRSLDTPGGPEYAAVCTDCHGVHDIQGVGAAHRQAREPRTCGRCHREAFDEYSSSIHGREASRGNPDVPLCIDCHGEHAMAPRGREEATCVDCHGVHDIRPAADPRSKVFPANLPGTCGQTGCHPKMTSKIAAAKIHRDYGRRSSGAPYYVRKVFLWAVLLAAVLSLIYLLPLLVRRGRGRPKT
jgi:hypothetical protein